jgi:hypothetical protein
MTERIRHFRYIVVSKIEAAAHAGWYLTDAFYGTCHGEYAVLGEWLCECPERWPL